MQRYKIQNFNQGFYVKWLNFPSIPCAVLPDKGSKTLEFNRGAPGIFVADSHDIYAFLNRFPGIKFLPVPAFFGVEAFEDQFSPSVPDRQLEVYGTFHDSYPHIQVIDAIAVGGKGVGQKVPHLGLNVYDLLQGILAATGVGHNLGDDIPAGVPIHMYGVSFGSAAAIAKVVQPANPVGRAVENPDFRFN